jgi:flagellum-specific peptidoglycan hydrolase FlgJ
LNKSIEVYNLLLAAGLSKILSGFAVAQACHETAGFTSNIFISNNNCFGMKYAGQINAQGEKNGYANYQSINNSVKDFVAWYTKHRNSIFSLPLYISSISSYVRFLKNNSYFTAPESEYLKGVTYFYNQIFG